MKKIIGVLALFMTHSAYAILSPLNQNVPSNSTPFYKVQSYQHHLKQALPILEMQKVGNGYIFFTEEEELQVEVQYLPQNEPRTYSI